MGKKRELITLIIEMAKALRCCHHDGMICENITLNQFFILDQVAQKKLLKLSDLHEILSVEKSTTTRLLDPLVKQGLLSREKSTEDSRAVNIRLTDDGVELHHNVWLCLETFANEVENNIPESKRTEVFDNIKLFLKALNTTCRI